MSDAIDPEWATWFMGFFEGDGSFMIDTNGILVARIELRNDDYALLQEVQATTQIGTLTGIDYSKRRASGSLSRDTVRWSVYGAENTALVNIFESADIDKYSAAWLGGFCDAEATFNIHSTGGLQFKIDLRNDDYEVLKWIRSYLGVGSFTHPGKIARFAAYGSDTLRVVETLEGKMKSKKATDFEIWAEAVRFAASQKQGAAGKKEKLLEYKAALEDARRYVAPSEEELKALAI